MKLITITLNMDLWQDMPLEKTIDYCWCGYNMNDFEMGRITYLHSFISAN